MSQQSLVTRFSLIDKSTLPALKARNKCLQVHQGSQKWLIHFGTSEQLFPPDTMADIHGDIMLNRIAPQQVIIFESNTEAYAAMCQTNYIDYIIELAQLESSEAAFNLVKELGTDRQA